ncbi:MAG: hypothetical protein EBY80_04105 [Actinobacteria bacterium]|nr:hypothetical protein [Actinomycetota bacterium]
MSQVVGAEDSHFSSCEIDRYATFRNAVMKVGDGEEQVDWGVVPPNSNLVIVHDGITIGRRSSDVDRKCRKDTVDFVGRHEDVDVYVSRTTRFLGREGQCESAAECPRDTRRVESLSKRNDPFDEVHHHRALDSGRGR